MPTKSSEKSTSNPLYNAIGTAVVIGGFASIVHWITGNGPPEVFLGKILTQITVAALPNQICVNNNAGLGAEVASLMCACRKQAIPKYVTQAKTMEQLKSAGSLGQNYCAPIAKSYLNILSNGGSLAAGSGSPPILQSPGTSSVGQYDQLLYQMIMRQSVEGASAFRSMVSANPYSSSSFSSLGFDLSSIYPTGHSAVFDEGSYRYRVQVTGPQTFAVSECRAIDCSY